MLSKKETKENIIKIKIDPALIAKEINAISDRKLKNAIIKELIKILKK